MAINQLNKYVWLVETIHRAKKKGGITLKEIQCRWSDSDLSEGTELSRRTFINNIHSIEELFEISIECGSGYRYNIEYGDCFEEGSTRSWMLNAFSLHAMVGNSRKLKERVLLEDMPSGRNFLEDIIKAMRDNHVIFISYYSYNSEKYYEFDIHPYFVKAFKKRWYVVAYSHGTDDIRCYALDRMENVIISDKVFKMPKDLKPAEYFKDCFGIINNEDSEVQKVVLKVDAFQSNYIRNLPLHKSQKEMKRTDEYSIFEYHLKPEFDFEQEIFSNMDTMEVLEPQWLREEITQRLKNLTGKYQI
ncbi:WYL domain-containing protein [Segatella copri]|uniref:helix-turn-helix transcriptional regulator n=1 Tax=Segatella copri TaxID=165179 RepID=UPI002FF05761